MLALAGASVLLASRAPAQVSGSVTVLHNFNGTDGSGPEQGLIKASDGNFYGVVVGGGTGGNGTIYKLTPDGQFSVLHAFQSQTEGLLPKAIIQGRDGNLYGVTRGGGTSVTTPAGGGTFFRLGLDGSFAKLYDFDTGAAKEGLFPSALVQGADGNFYGLTRDGGNTGTAGGTFFRLSPNGATRTELFAFQSGNGPRLPAGGAVDRRLRREFLRGDHHERRHGRLGQLWVGLPGNDLRVGYAAVCLHRQPRHFPARPAVSPGPGH